MLDCEFERMEAGWLMEEGRKMRHSDSTCSGTEDPMDSQEPNLSPRHSSSGMSIWDYIESYHKKSPIFQNFMYSPADQESVSFVCFKVSFFTSLHLFLGAEALLEHFKPSSVGLLRQGRLGSWTLI
jgi:hypothetical protein